MKFKRKLGREIKTGRNIIKIKKVKEHHQRTLGFGELFSNYLILIALFWISILSHSNDKIMVKKTGGR